MPASTARRFQTPLLAVPLALLSMAPGAAAPPERAKAIDCGPNSLFVLLELEGRPAPMGRILDALPGRHPEGYSMAELAEASARLGLPLEGIRVDAGAVAPSRPVIAFFRDVGTGHFAVVRPVGVTGKMVQVIDPPFAPQIVDFEQLPARTGWTGRVLMRRSVLDRPWVRPALMVAGVVLAGAVVVGRWMRSRASGDGPNVLPEGPGRGTMQPGC